METIANPDPVKVIGRASECMRRLMEAGLSFEDLQKPIDDPEMRDRLVRFWQYGGFVPSINQKRAREIMGKNFFGIEEDIKHFGVNPTRRELAALSEIPFSEAVLEKSRDTHVLVAVFPLSILEIRGKVARNLFGSHEDAWYNEQSFAKERGEISWQLVRKIPVTNSNSKNWAEQQALLGEDDEVPSAQVMVYTIIGHYLATGERLFKEIYVRATSLDSDGSRISVGRFDESGLDVGSDWGVSRRFSVGLAVCRKVQSL